MLSEDPLSDERLAEWSVQSFYGVGVWVNLLAPHWTQSSGYKNWIGNNTTDFVRRAHGYDLKVNHILNKKYCTVQRCALNDSSFVYERKIDNPCILYWSGRASFAGSNKIIVGVLQVHVFTLRNEDRYLAWDFGQDVHNAFDFYLSQRVDGMFTDFPQSLARHLDLLYKNTSAARCTKNTLYVTFVVLIVPTIVFCLLIHWNNTLLVNYCFIW